MSNFSITDLSNTNQVPQTISYPSSNFSNGLPIYTKEIQFLQNASGQNGNYLKIPLKDSGTNITDAAGNSYTTVAMYIFGIIHDNINGLTDTQSTDTSNIVGEVVFENIPSSTDNGIFYTCILLENSGKTPTKTEPGIDIDTIVSMHKTGAPATLSFVSNNWSGSDYSSGSPTKNTSISFGTQNNRNKNQGIIYSTNYNDVVYIYKSTILINNDTATYIKTNLDIFTKFFGKYGSNNNAKYNASSISTPIVEGFIEGVTGDITVIDCQPIDPDGRGAKTTMALVPLEYDAKQDFANTTQNFYIFSLGAIFCFFIVPIIYSQFFIEILKKTLFGVDAIAATKTRRDIESCLIFLFVVMTIVLVSFPNSQAKAAGLFFAIFLILSVGLIQIRSKESDFLPQGLNSPNDGSKSTLVSILETMTIKYAKAHIDFFAGSGSKWWIAGWFIVMIIYVLVVCLPLGLVLKPKDEYNANASLATLLTIGFVIVDLIILGIRDSQSGTQTASVTPEK